MKTRIVIIQEENGKEKSAIYLQENGILVFLFTINEFEGEIMSFFNKTIRKRKLFKDLMKKKNLDNITIEAKLIIINN